MKRPIVGLLVDLDGVFEAALAACGNLPSEECDERRAELDEIKAGVRHVLVTAAALEREVAVNASFALGALGIEEMIAKAATDGCQMGSATAAGACGEPALPGTATCVEHAPRARNRACDVIVCRCTCSPCQPDDGVEPGCPEHDTSVFKVDV